MSGSTGSRVGVYVCHCGGNISDVIDVKAVAAALGERPEVAVAREYPFMCSDAGQRLIAEDLAAGRVDRVVVAACSPALHELTFRKVLERAGHNPFLFEHVNIREQASWVHKHQPAEATQKARALTRAGVAKVVRQQPLDPIRIAAARHVLVIGGGPAGLAAALSLHRVGVEVTLVERGGALGGRLNELGALYPNKDQAGELRRRLAAEVEEAAGVRVLLGQEVSGIDGFVGRFQVALSSGVTLTVGAVVIATGADAYQPRPGELGTGSPGVTTLPDFMAWLATLPAGQQVLHHHGREIRSLALVHCVGSRQTEGRHAPQADGKVNDYCSRICCTSALHAAEEVQRRFPGTRILDVYRDIRTYGRGHEELYARVSRRGALFFRQGEDEDPVVENGRVTLRDGLTWNEEVAFSADLVVLVTGLVARPIPAILDSLKLPRGTDRFLQEAHPKLRPVEILAAGVFLAGSCQAPMDLGEAVTAGQGAAAKAAILLAREEILLEPFVAVVDQARCDGCEACLAECSYEGAIVMNEGHRAQVNPALCKGCGACAPVCSPRAIAVAGWSLEQLEAMVEAIAEEAP
jgi:heterodisulfide reductase subunit A2